MSRARTILLALLLLLAYGSGGLRALHALSHEHGGLEHEARGPGGLGAARLPDPAAVGHGGCGGSHGPGTHACTGPSRSSDIAAGHGGGSDGTAPVGASEQHDHESHSHGQCGLCEMLATAAPIVIGGSALPTVSGLQIDRLTIDDQVAHARAGLDGLGARGPPQA